MRYSKSLSVLLHVVVIYLCAVRISPSLAGRWFAWFESSLSGTAGVSAGDWYLQHLEFVTVIPALVFGFLVAEWLPYGSTSSWITPSVILIFEMIFYSAPHSALVSSPTGRFSYFFKIQGHMPEARNWLHDDPVRVYKQMVVTAPFYSGLSYAIGAVLALRWRDSRKS